MKDNNTSIILITEKEKKERKRWKERWKKMLHSYFLVLKDISFPFIKKREIILNTLKIAANLRKCKKYYKKIKAP